ncbi:MAG: UPF0147 family protein [Nanoarchaeota archaeon]|nr:UPF0147 family protein [Nanoarchaeota archaeon]
MTEKLEQAKTLLMQISEDRTVPRNIRESAKSAKEILDSQEELTVKVDRAIQILDEVSDDPNMPTYTRTQIWSIVSLLESILS